jgi:hypothetical protein
MVPQKNKVSTEENKKISVFSVRASLHVMYGYHVFLFMLVLRYTLQCVVYFTFLFSGF